jgi:hypothetical protein
LKVFASFFKKKRLLLPLVCARPPRQPRAPFFLFARGRPANPARRSFLKKEPKNFHPFSLDTLTKQ